MPSIASGMYVSPRIVPSGVSIRSVVPVARNCGGNCTRRCAGYCGGRIGRLPQQQSGWRSHGLRMTPRSTRQPQSAQCISMSLTSLWPIADGKFSRSVQGYDEGQQGAVVSRTSGGRLPVGSRYTRRRLGASSCRPRGLGRPAVVSEEAGEQAPAPARRLISAGVDGAPDGWDADIG
jgi:hypothetical protein